MPELKSKQPATERTEKDFEKMELVMQKMVGCLNHYKKMERQIMNEPESEAKFEKVELMRKVIMQLSDPVNFWNNYQKKCQKKMEEEAEAKRKAEAKAKFEREQKAFLDRQGKPQEKTYNIGCRHYCMTTMPGRNGSKPVVEHRCDCGMDMTYCGKHCAFATNAIKSTPAYDAPIMMNHRRAKKNAD